MRSLKWRKIVPEQVVPPPFIEQLPVIPVDVCIKTVSSHHERIILL
jgi:hypothetical protein